MIKTKKNIKLIKPLYEVGEKFLNKLFVASSDCGVSD